MDDTDVVDQVALIAGRLAGLVGKHRSTMDAGKLAADLDGEITELSRIRGQLMASKSTSPPAS